MSNRTTPYTDGGLPRVVCSHCGKKPSKHQWDLQAAGLTKSIWKALCRDCDLDLNRNVLDFFHFDKADAVMAAYVKATS